MHLHPACAHCRSEAAYRRRPPTVTRETTAWGHTDRAASRARRHTGPAQDLRAPKRSLPHAEPETSTEEHALDKLEQHVFVTVLRSRAAHTICASQGPCQTAAPAATGRAEPARSRARQRTRAHALEPRSSLKRGMPPALPTQKRLAWLLSAPAKTHRYQTGPFAHAAQPRPPHVAAAA